MTIHSSILVWRTPWTEGPGGLQARGSPRAGHDRATNILRNLEAGQEATVRISHGTMDWFQIGKGV